MFQDLEHMHQGINKTNKFNPNGVSESYKEFLNVFYLITQYNVAENLEKEKLLANYADLAEKLSYPLFDPEYIRNYNFKD